MKTEQDIAEAESTEELTALYQAWIAEDPKRKDYGCAMETVVALTSKPDYDVYEARWLWAFCARWEEVQDLEDAR